MRFLKKYEIKYDKQVAPLELNTLFVFNATNSWLRRSQRKTNGSRRDNHALFENICEQLVFYGRDILQYALYRTVESFKKLSCYNLFPLGLRALVTKILLKFFSHPPVKEKASTSQYH